MKFFRLIIVFSFCISCSNNEFDIIIINGTVVDGSGQERYQSDIGIVGAARKSLVYRMGEKSHLIDTDNLVDEIESMVRAHAEDLAKKRENEIIRVR